MTDAKEEQAIQEQAKSIIAMARESPFFVTGVTGLDGTYSESKKPLDVSVSALSATAMLVSEEVPTASYMLIGVGPKKCTILAHVASNAAGALDPSDWLRASMAEPKNFQIGDTYASLAKTSGVGAFGFYEAEYPIKAKDTIIGLACAYLRQKHLLDEEGSDDERPPFDINADD